MFKIYTDADQVEGPWPLACDPAVAAVNDDTTLREYLAESDHAVLTVPPDALLFGIRPLSEEELEDLDELAGDVPHYGREVQAAMRARIEDEGLSAQEARAQLSADEKAAWRAYRDWQGRRNEAMLSLAVETLGGQPFDVLAWLKSLRRRSVIQRVKSELIVHASNITDLGYGPKAPSSPPSTSPSSPVGSPGAASSATLTPGSGGDEDTVKAR